MNACKIVMLSIGIFKFNPININKILTYLFKLSLHFILKTYNKVVKELII